MKPEIDQEETNGIMVWDDAPSAEMEFDFEKMAKFPKLTYTCSESSNPKDGIHWKKT